MCGGARRLGVAPAFAAGVDEAKALIAKYSKLPTFEAPGPAFDAKACMKGKKIFAIPLTDANPFDVAIVGGMEQAAKIVGFPFRSLGDPALARPVDAGHQQGGRTEGYNLDRSRRRPAAGIHRAADRRGAREGRQGRRRRTTTTLTQKAPDFLDGSAKTDYVTVGKLIAAWAIAKTDGKVDAVVLGPDEITPTGAAQEAILDYFKENCPTCKTDIHQHARGGMGDQDPTGGAGARCSPIPTINYVLPIYDSMSQFVVPAIVSDRVRSAKIVSYNGTPFVLDMMRDGDIVEMDVGESLGWVGMAGIDADMRAALRPATGDRAQHARLYLRQVERRDRRQAGDLQRRLWRRAYRRLQEALGHQVIDSPAATRGRRRMRWSWRSSPSGSAGRSRSTTSI